MKSVLIFTFLLLIISCNEENPEEWLLPGFTSGGTNYYPHPATKCGINPAFHFIYPRPSENTKYILFGDLHTKTGIEILADSAKSTFILYDSRNNVLWRNEHQSGALACTPLPMDGIDKSIISCAYAKIEGTKISGKSRQELLLWNMVAVEPFFQCDYDPYLETINGREIIPGAINYFITGEGIKIAHEYDLCKGLANLSMRYGTDINGDGNSDYVLGAYRGFAASDRFSKVVRREILTKSKRAIVPVKGESYLGAMRSVGVYSPGSGGLRWLRNIPIDPDIRAIRDLNGDGVKEIIVAGKSPQNGVTLLNGTDSGMGYVYAFTYEGTLLWDYPVPGLFVRTFACVADVCGDSKEEVLITCSSFYGNWGHIAVLKAKTGDPIYQSDTDFSLLGLSSFKERNDEKNKWYCGSTKGFVYRFHFSRNGKLQMDSVLVAESDSIFNYPNVFVMVSNDIDGDNTTEIVCLINKIRYENFRPFNTDMIWNYPELVVLSSKLAEENRYTFEKEILIDSKPSNDSNPKGFIIDMDNNGTNELIIDCAGRSFIFFSYY